MTAIIVARQPGRVAVLLNPDAPAAAQRAVVVREGGPPPTIAAPAASLLMQGDDWDWADEPLTPAVAAQLSLAGDDLLPPPVPSLARAYNPDEPREPAGSPAGGQWTSGDSGAAGTATAERDAPAAPPSEAQLRAAFEGTFGGLTARVASYTPYVESDGRLSGAQVTGQIRTADGREVGQFYRSFAFGDGEVTHAGFALQPDQQGQGFATAFIAHSEAAYRAMGMKRITVAANTDVGGYAWAQQGYDFDHYHGHGQVEQMAQRVWAFANQAADRSPIPPAGQRAVYSEANRLLKRVQQREAVSAREMSQVGRQYPWVDPRSGRQLWAGKAAMLGSKWSGEKVL